MPMRSSAIHQIQLVLIYLIHALIHHNQMILIDFTAERLQNYILEDHRRQLSPEKKYTSNV